MKATTKRSSKSERGGVRLRTPGESPFHSAPVRQPIGEDHPARLLFRQIRAEETSGPAQNIDNRPPAEDVSLPAVAELPGSDSEQAPSHATNAEGVTALPQAMTEGAHAAPAQRAPARRHQAGGKLSFEEFVMRWSPLLRSGGRTGKLDICRVLYEQTYAVGKRTCFTSYEKLGALCGLGKATTVKNVKQLEELGFIERAAVYNTATKKGTEFRLHLERVAPEDQQRPVLHLYDN